MMIKSSSRQAICLMKDYPCFIYCADLTDRKYAVQYNQWELFDNVVQVHRWLRGGHL